MSADGGVDGAGARDDSDGRRRKKRRGERPVAAEDYYGRPIIKPPVWEEREIAGYLFTGGLAGASSILAAGADLTGRPTLARGSTDTRSRYARVGHHLSVPRGYDITESARERTR